MKIAIDARLIGNSGIGTYIENIVPMLVNRHKQHHYLLIGHERQIGLYRGIFNVELLLTEISQFSLKECVAFPVEEINKCDAFYCPYINVPGGIRVPVYSTIHDVIFLDIKGLSSRLGTLLRWAFYKRAIYLSEALFTVSEFSATNKKSFSY
jgi:glycosyltransferase involved in cell wall biosynthesis